MTPIDAKRGTMQENPKISRRSFLAAAGGAIVSIALPGYWESMGFSNSADPWKEDR